MSATGEVDGVLICGVYGTGKSSLAAEIAETLERHGVSYGALDLDWLTWFDVPGMDHTAEWPNRAAAPRRREYRRAPCHRSSHR